MRSNNWLIARGHCDPIAALPQLACYCEFCCGLRLIGRTVGRKVLKNQGFFSVALPPRGLSNPPVFAVRGR
jgi:hypothetical protein